MRCVQYRIVLLLALSGGAFGPATAHAGQVSPPTDAVVTQSSPRDVALRIWLDIVALYRSGDAESALRRLKNWPEAQRMTLEHAFRASLDAGSQNEAGAIAVRDAEASILLLLYAAHDAFASDADGRPYLKLAVSLARAFRRVRAVLACFSSAACTAGLAVSTRPRCTTAPRLRQFLAPGRAPGARVRAGPAGRRAGRTSRE